jgi:hypothetical protein
MEPSAPGLKNSVFRSSATKPELPDASASSVKVSAASRSVIAASRAASVVVFRVAECLGDEFKLALGRSGTERREGSRQQLGHDLRPWVILSNAWIAAVRGSRVRSISSRRLIAATLPSCARSRNRSSSRSSESSRRGLQVRRWRPHQSAGGWRETDRHRASPRWPRDAGGPPVRAEA